MSPAEPETTEKEEEAVSRRKRLPESKAFDAIIAILEGDEMDEKAALRVVDHVYALYREE
jgi:hypothetical protein